MIPLAEAAHGNRGAANCYGRGYPSPLQPASGCRKKVSTAFGGGRITSDGGVMLLAQAQGERSQSCGTESSNPCPSSGESAANRLSRIRIGVWNAGDEPTARTPANSR